MVEQELARRATRITKSLIEAPTYSARSFRVWLVERVLELKAKIENPKICDLRGEDLEEFVDDQVRFLVEETGIRPAAAGRF